MKFWFTRHAVSRCKERGIRLRDIKAELKNIESSIVKKGEAIEIRRKVRTKTLVIVFKSIADTVSIITAYYD